MELAAAKRSSRPALQTRRLPSRAIPTVGAAPQSSSSYALTTSSNNQRDKELTINNTKDLSGVDYQKLTTQTVNLTHVSRC